MNVNLMAAVMVVIIEGVLLNDDCVGNFVKYVKCA
jgi:hypothetical protein